MVLSSRVLEGFAVAALAQNDAEGALALPGFTPELAVTVQQAMRGLAGAEPALHAADFVSARRRAFLRSALGRPAVDPELAERFRAAPELLAYLAQLARTR